MTSMKRLGHGKLMFHSTLKTHFYSPECSGHINESCFRQHHFYWCTAHEKMTGYDGLCPDNPPESAPNEVMRCREIQCDKNEEEAYWAEVEENSLMGGAGFREPGEPHVH